MKTLFFLAVTFGLLLAALFTPLGDCFDRDSIRGFFQPLIAAHKWQAVLLFILAMTVLPMLWVPRLVMTAVAGALFGLKEGFFYAMIGSTTAGLIGYWFAQGFTSAYFERQVQGNRLLRALDFTKHNAFWLILLARICPVTHYEVINYLCGTSNVRFWPFFWSTFLGIIPGTFVYVMMGDAILQHGWWSPELRQTLWILGVLLIGTGLGFFCIIRRGRCSAPPASHPLKEDTMTASPLNHQNVSGFEAETVSVPTQNSHEQPVEYQSVHEKPPNENTSTGSTQENCRHSQGFRAGIALLALVILGAVPVIGQPAVERFMARTVSVADGDTLTVRRLEDGRKEILRLKGVDAPETAHGRKGPGQAFGQEAREFVREFALQQTVEVEGLGRDPYGRLLARVERNGKSLNGELVRAGLAYAFSVGRETPPVERLQEEAEARNARRGFWAVGWRVRPKLYRRFSSLKRLEADYQGQNHCIRSAPFPRLALFEPRGDWAKDTARVRRILGKSGLRYLAVVVEYRDAGGREWLGMPLIDRPDRSFAHPVHTLADGDFAGSIGRVAMPAELLEAWLQACGYKTTGEEYRIHWVDATMLKRARLPGDETLVERLRPVKP